MKKIESWHRKHALMLAAQLPENTNDALAVLEACREIVQKFLDPAGDQPSGENVFHLTKNQRL